VRPVDLSQGQAIVGGLRGPDLISLEPEHPRKQVGHADVVVHDEHAGRVSAVWLGHWPIVSPAKDPSRESLMLYSGALGRSYGRFLRRPSRRPRVAGRLRYGLSFRRRFC
jgi:hypothetical protein